MLTRLESGLSYSTADEVLQIKFKNLYNRLFARHTDARVGGDFLRQHAGLLGRSNMAIVLQPKEGRVELDTVFRILLLTLRPREEYSVQLLRNDVPVNLSQVSSRSRDEQLEDAGELASELAREYPGERQTTVFEAVGHCQPGHNLLVLKIGRLPAVRRNGTEGPVEAIDKAAEDGSEAQEGGEESILLGRYFCGTAAN
jgi:hypothetical protein